MQDELEAEQEKINAASRQKAEKARDGLLHRQQCYREVFDMTKPAVIVVMEDLSRYCRVHTTTFNSNPALHAFAEGRKDAMLRVIQHLELDLAKLWKLYNNGG